MKKAKLLDAEKVINALEMAKSEVYFPGYFDSNKDAVTESLRRLIHEEAKAMIENAIFSFVISLTRRLEECEVDNYPCALCYEEEKDKRTHR